MPCEWNLEFDIEKIRLNSLIVDGTLVFSRAFANITLEANYIWIRGG